MAEHGGLFSCRRAANGFRHEGDGVENRHNVAPPINPHTTKSETHRETPHGREGEKKSIVSNCYLDKKQIQFSVVFEASPSLSVRKDLLLVSGKSLQCNDALSSFVCGE